MVAGSEDQAMRTLLTGLATITAISAIAATPAAALTKVGTFVSPGTTSWSAMADLPFGDATGLYLLTFDLSRAGAGQFIGRATKSFEFYCFEDHEHCGGDDHPVEKVQDFAHATHLEMLFKINPPYIRDFGGGFTEEGYYYDGHAILMANFMGHVIREL